MIRPAHLAPGATREATAPPHPAVLVLGDLMLDLGLDAPAPDAHGAPCHATHHTARLGGSAARTAVALAALGCRVRLVACLGADPVGDALRTALQDAGVDGSALIVVPDGATGIGVTIATPSGAVSAIVARGANDALAPCHVPDLAGFDWVHLSGYALRTPSGRAAARLLAAGAVAGNVRVSLDPGVPAGSAVMDEVRSMLPAVTWLLPNEREALWLTGCDTPSDAARELRGAGARNVVVKRAAAGCLVATAGGSDDIAAPRIREGDVTGAGDAFDAGLIAATLGGLDAAAAATAATVCGAFVVARGDNTTAVPSATDALRLLAAIERSPAAAVRDAREFFRAVSR